MSFDLKGFCFSVFLFPTRIIKIVCFVSKVLFASEPEAAATATAGHECIMFYKSPSSNKGAEGAAELNSLAAIRCGDYKVYWMIDGGSSTPLPEGLKTGILSLEAPVIFDVSKDLSEDTPLSPTSAEWQTAKKSAEAARLAHLKTLTRNIGQMGRGNSHAFAICGDPDSETKHPNMPNCTVSPENWSPPICLVGGSRGACINQEQCHPGTWSLASDLMCDLAPALRSPCS